MYNKKEQEQIDITDKHIRELVYKKTKVLKAYNYYHGKRDPDQFRHLEENYGIGTPTSVKFVPLVRKHIDVLVGEYLTIPVLPKISIKDEDTLSKIAEDRKEHVKNEVHDLIRKHLRKILRGEFDGSEFSKNKLLKEVNDLQEFLEHSFISEYEIAAQNIVDWSLQNRDIDFVNTRRIILTDLLITGTCYYRALENTDETEVKFKALNPLDTFIDRKKGSNFHKDSTRAVIREHLTKDEILEEWGDWLTQEDIDRLDSQHNPEYDSFFARGESPYYWSEESDSYEENILGGRESYHNNTLYTKRFTVYDVEWLQTDKEKDKYVTNRYRSIRIGNDIYILFGKIDNVRRSTHNKKSATLSINGVFNADRNGEPLSLILATSDLQDRFDVLSFFRDNIIAQSGTAGDWVDVAFIPKMFGSDLSERLVKWLAYKKQGIAIIDSSIDGMPPMNTTFGGFDDTLKLQTIEAIELAIEKVEETTSTITGVFREKLGGIEQKDAVTNVQVGIRQSTYITKQYYYMMDLITREALLDIIDSCRVVFKKGIQGTIVLGDKLNKVFTALPEHYTVSDYDIHLNDTSETIQELETMRQLGVEFISMGTMSPDLILDVFTSKSLTKTKRIIQESIRKNKEENDIAAQLEQQLQQTTNQLQQYEKEMQQLQKQLEQLSNENNKMEQAKFQQEMELEWFKAKAEKEFKDETIEAKKMHIQAEVLELYDENPLNDEVKNVK